MTRTRSVFLAATAVIVVAIVPVRGAADGPAAPDSAVGMKDRIAGLIRDLAHDSRNQRAVARRELLKLGPEILPLLPAPEELPNASVKAAVREIRLNLEKTKARESVKPSHVAVPAATTLEAFLALVKKETGNDADVRALPPGVMKKSIALDKGRHTFWQAMDQVAQQAGFSYVTGSRASSLELAPLGSDSGRQSSVAYDGVFRVAVPPAQLRPIAGDDAHRLLRVEVEILAEPRLRPLFLQYASRDLTAFGERRQRLPSFSPEASYELPVLNAGSVVARTDFRVPASMDLKHFDLAGELKMQTAAGAETFRFDNLDDSQGKARRRGGVVATLQKVNFHAAGADRFAADIGIAVAYESGGPAFESHRTWIFHNETYLETRDGRRIEPESDFQTLLQADGAVAVEYRFEGLSGNSGKHRFVYVAPTLIINVPITFEIRQIPVSSSNP